MTDLYIITAAAAVNVVRNGRMIWGRAAFSDAGRELARLEAQRVIDGWHLCERQRESDAKQQRTAQAIDAEFEEVGHG